MNETGFDSRKAISIFKYGYKTVIYEIIPEGTKDPGKCVFIHDAEEEIKPSRKVLRMIDKFHRKGDMKIDFNRGNRIFLKDGWSRNEISDGDFPYCWADDIQSSVVIPMKEPSDYEMELKVHSIVYKNSPAQWIKIHVNGKYVSEIMPSGLWDVYAVDIPGEYWSEGENTISFSYNYLASPIETLGLGDPRDISVAFAHIKLRVRS